MVSTGWLCLAAMIFAYGCANLLQSVAARRTQCCHSLQPTLLLRLANQRIYLYGVGFQLLGFGLAFFARRELPLFLVQASVAAGVGVMALMGCLFLRWRLPRAEIGLLALLGLGIGSLVFAARPAIAHRLSPIGFALLVAVLVAIGVLGFFAARLRGTLGAAALGSLAGLAFGAAAVDSRALAGAHHWSHVVLSPLLYLLFAHGLLGQLLVGMAMQRGTTTVAVASMDAAATVPAAVIGLALLGDQIWPGRQWLAALGFVVTLVAVLGLARYAQPQHGGVGARDDAVPAAEAVPRDQRAGVTVPARTWRIAPGARPSTGLPAPRQRSAPNGRAATRGVTRRADSPA